MGKSLKIIVFSCNWDGLSCVEAAAHARLSYPTSVKIIRLSCLSRVHAGLILKAFELGGNGVILLGCEKGKCHYDVDSYHITREVERAQGILRVLGIGPKRVLFTPMPRADGSGFVSRLNTFIAELGTLGAGALTNPEPNLMTDTAR